MAVDEAALLSASPSPLCRGARAAQPVRQGRVIAARAARASTRRQYMAICRDFGDWLATQLGRPPVVDDLKADVIAAYWRHLATRGGRSALPGGPATLRVYLSMLRALGRDLGREEQVDGVRGSATRAQTTGDRHQDRLRQISCLSPTAARLRARPCESRRTCILPGGLTAPGSPLLLEPRAQGSDRADDDRGCRPVQVPELLPLTAQAPTE